jgi:hypothetical protein
VAATDGGELTVQEERAVEVHPERNLVKNIRDKVRNIERWTEAAGVRQSMKMQVDEMKTERKKSETAREGWKKKKTFESDAERKAEEY